MGGERRGWGEGGEKGVGGVREGGGGERRGWGGVREGGGVGGERRGGGGGMHGTSLTPIVIITYTSIQSQTNLVSPHTAHWVSIL